MCIPTPNATMPPETRAPGRHRHCSIGRARSSDPVNATDAYVGPGEYDAKQPVPHVRSAVPKSAKTDGIGRSRVGCRSRFSGTPPHPTPADRPAHSVPGAGATATPLGARRDLLQTRTHPTRCGHPSRHQVHRSALSVAIDGNHFRNILRYDAALHDDIRRCP